MTRRHPGPGVLVCIPLLAMASHASAQAVHVGAAVDQTFTSADALDSPTGFRLAVTGSRLWHRLGLQFTVRRLWQHNGEIPGFCGAFSCTDGPFDQVSTLGAAGLGLTAVVDPSATTEIILALNASLYWQATEVRPIGSGESFRRDSHGPDLGLGASVDGLFPEVFASIRPVVFLRYDRVRGGECALDASCVGGRHVASVGAGLAWKP